VGLPTAGDSLLAPAVSVILSPMDGGPLFGRVSPVFSPPVVDRTGSDTGTTFDWVVGSGISSSPWLVTRLHEPFVGSRTEPSDMVMVLYQVSLVTVRGEDEATEDALHVPFSRVEESTPGCDMSLEGGEYFLESCVEGLEAECEVPQKQQCLYRKRVSFASNVDLEARSGFPVVRLVEICEPRAKVLVFY
jgi:hypothetical protein